MRGILFKPDMIEAIVEGRKTQTRRVIKHQPQRLWNKVMPIKNAQGRIISWCFYEGTDPDFHGYLKEKLRYQVGVYIKEAWATENQYNHLKPSEIPHTAKIFYLQDEHYDPFTMGIKRSPLFMPAWAARLFCLITSIKVELFNLSNLTPKDLELEGGESALTLLKQYDGRWVWVYSFKLVPRP